MEEPLLSVITINYNNLRGLQATFDSVFAQTAIGQFEYIVVDGNSSDGSAELIGEHRQKISQVHIGRDKGIYDAMNKGFEMSRGSYVWFLNSGDRMHGNDIAEKVLEAAKKNPDVIYGETMFCSTEGTELGTMSRLTPRKLPHTLNRNTFRMGMNICHQSFIAKKSLAVPYRLEFRHVADIDWIISILKKCKTSERLDVIISDFELGGHSQQQRVAGWKERFRVLASQYGFVPTAFNHLLIALRSLCFRLTQPKSPAG